MSSAKKNNKTFNEIQNCPFKDLKKQLKNQKLQKNENENQSKDHSIQNNELSFEKNFSLNQTTRIEENSSTMEQLFPEIIPIKNNKVSHLNQNILTKEQMNIRKKFASVNTTKILKTFSLNEPVFLNYDDVLSFTNTGLTARELQIIKSKFHKDIQIDLHGFTIEQAAEELAIFIDNAIRTKKWIIQIIHGKGEYQDLQSKLKSYVYYWMKNSDDVAGGYHAKDGGSLYIILRSKKTTKPDN